jgi:hypothetical protein
VPDYGDSHLFPKIYVQLPNNAQAVIKLPFPDLLGYRPPFHFRIDTRCKASADLGHPQSNFRTINQPLLPYPIFECRWAQLREQNLQTPAIR